MISAVAKAAALGHSFPRRSICHGAAGQWRISWRSLSSSRHPGDDSPDGRVVSIGDVSVKTKPPQNWALVPRGYDKSFGSAVAQTVLAHLRWMMQKDALKQDMFLLGSPGSSRRQLAFRFAELTEREIEYVAISRDTTESDLKQRREIVDGSAIFVDQPPVRAALNGRLLIIDGIEKAERNVLPTLNNLLENREMQLDDGRFLMDATRYDELSSSGALKGSDHIVRAHPDFRVVALGLPVPPFKGKPLDPPLRSRFQVRVVDPLGSQDLWPDLIYAISEVDPAVSANPKDNPRIMALCQVMAALREVEETWKPHSHAESHSVIGMPHFPEAMLPSLAKLSHAFPEEQVGTFLARSFPYFGKSSFGREHEAYRKTTRLLLQQHADSIIGAQSSGLNASTLYSMVQIKPNNDASADDRGNATFHFKDKNNGPETTLVGHVGPLFSAGHTGRTSTSRRFHAIDKHQSLLTGMMQDHCVGRDILLFGDAGSGKSRLAEEFALRLGYETQLFSLYKDMSARDLLQRRTTDNKGNTGWDSSPLISAAVNGDLLILDGVDRVDSDTLTVIQRLLCDREIELLDGRRLNSAGQDRVHPRFRVIALATTGSSKGGSNWMTSELLSMFSFHHLERLLPAEQEVVIRACFPEVPAPFLDTLRLTSLALSEEDKTRASHQPQRSGKKKAGISRTTRESEESGETRAASLGLKPLSTRQAMRLCRFAEAFPDRAMNEMRERIRNILLGHFLPVSQRKGLEQLFDEVGVPAAEDEGKGLSENKLHNGKEIEIVVSENEIRIGDVVAPVSPPQNPELVPSPLFFDIPKHKQALQDILEDIVCGERYLLLIGNQGVGKNKLADRLLQLLQREREYIQLHRDSTVGTLTLSPNLRQGIVIWEDSPLVRAAVHGRTLMVDEIDKAPLEVVSVLKSLIEDEEMLLADGRRLVSCQRFNEMKELGLRTDKLISIHPSFSIVALANRPGWPFQGNSFFAEIGDIFCSHVISNPDARSELELISAYAPDVDVSILKKLVAAFSDLRALVEEGVLVYPYSARECVAVAKHLQKFPSDGLVTTLENVLGFDSYDSQLLDVIIGVFQRHGIPLTRKSGGRRSLTIAVADTKPMPPPVVTEEWK